MPEEQTKKGIWVTLIIVFVILVIIVGGYFGLAAILRKVNEGSVIQPTTSGAPNAQTATGKFTDQNLVGTWESDCLVPDPNSKWAEKHKFVILKDGTATHTRLDWELNDCTTLQPTGTITDQFKLTIPSSGKINLTYVSSQNPRMTESQAGQFAGAVIYDIYQVTGSTLEFGHGFRGDNLAYGSKTGGSDSDRFDSLNSFIVYKKK